MQEYGSGSALKGHVQNLGMFSVPAEKQWHGKEPSETHLLILESLLERQEAAGTPFGDRVARQPLELITEIQHLGTVKCHFGIFLPA